MRKLATISVLGLLGCIMLAGGPMAATLNVPSTEYPTIQSAINAAAPGDVVQVAAGTYRETSFGWTDLQLSKSISLIGAGSDQTIVELSGLQHGLEIIPDATGTVLVEGIAFTRRAENTYSAGWAVIVGETGGTFASIILRDVEIAYAQARNLHFASATYTYALVEDCSVHHSGAWGFSARGTLTDLNIVDSDFEYNGTADPAYGIGFDIDMPATVAGVTLTGGSFSHNTSKGINLVATNNAAFTGITASSNAGAPGGGFGVSLWEWSSSSSNLAFNGCTFADNATDGILFGTEGTCTITGISVDGCLITGNGRSGILFYHNYGGTASDIAVNGCYLAGNGPSGGIGRSALSSSIDGSANWWGDATPAGVAAAAGSNLDYTPWLADGTDLSGDPGFQADWSVLWVDDDSPQTGTAGRIQEAVDLVSGSTVNLAPGTYEEQVEIDKDLVLQGQGSSTEIVAPDAMSISWSTSSNYYAVVYVHDTGNAEIRDLVVDGAGKGNANYKFVGVGFRNAGGGVYGCDILDIRDTPFSGAQHGVAVNVWNDDLTLRSVDVHDCTIMGFQKNAMALNASDATGLTVDVRGNTITGAGATDVTAQNGIQVWCDIATGTIADNVISGIAYDNTASATKWVATSILQYFCDLSITGNTITGAHLGIYNIDGSGLIQGNDLTIEKIGVYAFGIIGSDPPKAVPSPAGADEMPAGSSRPMDGAPLAVLDVDIIDNEVTFSGTDNTATYGIEVDAGWGPDDLDATINGNSVTGFEVGLEMYVCETDCDTGVLTAIDARYNGLFGNTLAVRSNAGYLTIDASANWLGSNAPAALVSGDVDYTPWLDVDTDTGTAVGFQGDFSALHVDDDSPQVGAAGRAQEGVDLVSGSTLYLHEGTYEEQVEIAKDLVLQGDGPGTIILSPVDLPLFFGTNYPIVYVHDADDVEIRDLTVNGAGRGNANYRFVGVGFSNAGGGIYDCSVLDVRDTPFSGAQHGVAVYAYNTDGYGRTLDVHGCTITGFQKNAMALNAGDTTPLAVDVRGNTITGAGATTVTAQNGIQVWADLGTGEIDGNVVSGIGYAGTGWVATSILNYYSDLNYDGNTIGDAHVGIYNIDGSGVIENNEVEVELIGDYCYGIIASDPPEARPSPFGEEEALGAPGRDLLGAPLAVLDVDITGNTVTNVGTTVAGTYGIEADAGYGPDDLDLTITYNTVCNFEAAIEVWNCQTGCDTGVFTSVVANYNFIGCGNTYGIRSNADYIVTDGTNNWWGDASGPYHPTLNPSGTGDDVSDYVDFDPWLGAPNQLSVVPPYGTTTCLDPITFTFRFDHVGTGEVRGVDVTFQVDGGVVTVAALSDIAEGTYLPGFGSTTFFPLDMGGDVYRVSTSILGGTTGAVGSGDLFAVTFTPVGEGLSAITITDLKVRDVNNVPLAASMVGGEVRIDCTGPTMEPIAEAEGECYNAAPVFSNFGFDDDMNLDLAEYRIDAGGWVTIFAGIDAAEWNDDGWTLPGFDGLDEGSRTVYFRVQDDAGNLNDTYSWSFIKDTEPPEPPTGFTAMPGHNKVHLSWTNPAGDPSFTGVEIRMVAWGDYPEYLTAPSYPADHTGGTLVTQTALEAFDDDPRTPRDIYYYAAFSYDCAGNYSILGDYAKDRSTSYWLGDIYAGYDGYVAFLDLGDFSNTFGKAEGATGWNAEADFGPTDDWSRFGIPEPDDVIDFEDLMIFSMNYGNVDPSGFDLVPVERSPENLEGMIAFELVPSSNEDGTVVSIMLISRAATLKGARLLLEAGEGCEIVGATKGEIIAARGEVFFGTIPSHRGIELCVAALGVDRPLAGSGEIARILVRSSGPVSVSLAEAEVRDLDNRAFEIEGIGGYQGPEIPVADALGQNFPNPFNPATTIAFDLARPSAVRIGIYDVSGRLVRTLVDGKIAAGRHEIAWNGENNAGIGVPSGLYFYRMSTSEGFTATRKMILLR